MDFRFPLDQCPALQSLYFRTLELTFTDTIHALSQKITPIVTSLDNKQLSKCILVPEQSAIPEPKYEGVLLGGTFDYLHTGHQILLLTAIFLAQKKILVGVTGDQLLAKKKNKELIQTIQIRMKEVQDYIKKIKPKLQIQIVEINDPYGPAITRQDFEAIVVSAETKSGGMKVNEIRKERNMKQMVVEICPLVIQADKAKESSTQIREYILKKNRMTIEELVQYKNKWIDFNKRLCKHFKTEYSHVYMQTWWNRILHQYSEFWRFYHTNSHIFQMLNAFEKDPSKQKLTQKQLLVVQIGIWFHDVQYVPLKNNNEEESAETAQKFIKGLFKQFSQEAHQFIQISKEAILATKAHKAETVETKLLIDLDMSILDAPPQQYKQYAKMIRCQYQPIVKDLYNQERTKFLKSLNHKEVFYMRKPTHLQQNLEWELKHLAAMKDSAQL